MNVRILLVGRVKERYLQEGIQEYLKRLRPYMKIKLIEVQHEPVPDSPKEEELARETEAERLFRLFRPGECIVAMDVKGRRMSSVDFSEWLAEKGTAGKPKVSFVVGGTTGLSDRILSGAHLRLSLGSMTFPHQFMPLLILEQVYRAVKIYGGEPYHR